MPRVEGEPRVTILGEVGLEVHGLVESPSETTATDSTKTAFDLVETEVRIGGCAWFAALACRRLGTSCRLVAHVGGNSPSSGICLEDVGYESLLSAVTKDIRLVRTGHRSLYFSFWKERLAARSLYCKGSGGLRASDLEAEDFRSASTLLLSIADLGVYEMAARARDVNGSVLVASPNRTLYGNESGFSQALHLCDVLSLNSAEYERLTGTAQPAPEGLPAGRRACVVITSSSGIVSLVSPEGSVSMFERGTPSRAAYLGGGDAFAAGLASLWGSGLPFEKVIGEALVAAESIQPLVTPRFGIICPDGAQTFHDG